MPFDVVPGQVRFVRDAQDPRIPPDHQIKIDGYRTASWYTALGPTGRIGPDVATYAEALALLGEIDALLRRARAAGFQTLTGWVDHLESEVRRLSARELG